MGCKLAPPVHPIIIITIIIHVFTFGVFVLKDIECSHPLVENAFCQDNTLGDHFPNPRGGGGEKGHRQRKEGRKEGRS